MQHKYLNGRIEGENFKTFLVSEHNLALVVREAKGIARFSWTNAKTSLECESYIRIHMHGGRKILAYS